MHEEEEARIPTHLWVEAEVRRLSGLGLGVYIAHKGDRMGGTVIQKIADMSGKCRLLGQQRDLLGKLVWINLLQDEIVDEPEADACIKRATARDSDLWVVEIEDRTMQSSINS